MCGIAGVVGQPDREGVERMMQAMFSRGPDDSGIYQDESVVLGLRRLSILDLSSAGRQPMSRADGRLWIVYNGEIYNFRELRDELEARGYHFRSRTDTEVILALYEDMGTECVSRIRGMFAFAIWDRRTQDPLLFAARDHFGIKPLVYATPPGSFKFASDLCALVADGAIRADIDPVALQQYMMLGHVVQPRTILKDVWMLPAAHAMTVRPGQSPRMWRYWDFDHARCASMSAGLSFQEQSIRVRWLLTEAARKQMVSDVPLGAFLSGGCDSSSLVALMMQVSGRPVHTFAIGYAGVAQHLDETDDARKSAGLLGSIHENVSLQGREVAEAIPYFAQRLGQPSIDGLNMYFASRAASRGVTVALAGNGADEVFAGYPWFQELDLAWRNSTLGRRGIGFALSRIGFWRSLPRSRVRENWELRGLGHDLVSNYAEYHMIRPPSEMLRLVGGTRLDLDEVLGYRLVDDPALPDVITRVSRLDMKLFLCSRLLRDADAASMACSLEVRVPFLDVDLVEFAFGLPGTSKHGPLESGGPPIGKRVFIQAVKDLLPDWAYRKPKRGFSLPMREWLAGPLAPLADDMIADREFRTSGLLDPIEMDRAWRRFRLGLDVHWARVWTIVILGLWWRGLKDRFHSRDLASNSRPVTNRSEHATRALLNVTAFRGGL